MTRTTAISAAQLTTLSSIVEAAKASGEIEIIAVTTLLEAVRKEGTTNSLADYLDAKQIPADAKRRVAKLRKSPSDRSIRDLREMAAPYKRGDIPQMIEALKGVSMSSAERLAYDLAASEVGRPERYPLDGPALRWHQLDDILKRNGVNPVFETIYQAY